MHERHIVFTPPISLAAAITGGAPPPLIAMAAGGAPPPLAAAETGGEGGVVAWVRKPVGALVAARVRSEPCMSPSRGSSMS